MRAMTVLLAALAAPAAAAETEMRLPGGLDATLSMPEVATSPVPAVLMLHGFGSSKDEVGGMYAAEAAALAARGIASLRISFAGFGRSDGDTGSTTVDGQVADALAALGVLRDEEGVDGTRIGLLGFSLGGGVAILAAAQAPEEVAALATWSSVGDFAGDMKEELGQPVFDRARAEGIVGLDLGWRTMALKGAFFDSLEAADLAGALATLDLPILAVAGSEDFSAAYVEGFAQEGGVGSEAVVVPGADHIYGVLSDDPSMADSVVATTADWFGAHL